MSDSNGRAERIKEEIPILKLLYDYGYEVQPDSFVPQQFSCDLHGSRDLKPSARAYPETNSWYCWGCQKSRDVISTVCDKEGASFAQACSFLEKEYKLPEIDWGSDYVPTKKEKRDDFAIYKYQESLEDLQRRVHLLIDNETKDKLLPLDKVLSLWSIFDKLSFLTKSKTISPEKSKESFLKLREKVFELRKEHVQKQSLL